MNINLEKKERASLETQGQMSRVGINGPIRAKSWSETSIWIQLWNCFAKGSFPGAPLPILDRPLVSEDKERAVFSYFWDKDRQNVRLI